MVSGRYRSADIAFSCTKVIPLWLGGTSSNSTGVGAGAGAEKRRRGSRRVAPLAASMRRSVRREGWVQSMRVYCGHSKGVLMKQTTARVSSAVLLVALLATPAAHAQLNNASAVRGQVKDAQGLPIPGVSVELEFKGESRVKIVKKTVTDKKGGY